MTADTPKEPETAAGRNDVRGHFPYHDVPHPTNHTHAARAPESDDLAPTELEWITMRRSDGKVVPHLWREGRAGWLTEGDDLVRADTLMDALAVVGDEHADLCGRAYLRIKAYKAALLRSEKFTSAALAAAGEPAGLDVERLRDAMWEANTEGAWGEAIDTITTMASHVASCYARLSQPTDSEPATENKRTEG